MTHAHIRAANTRSTGVGGTFRGRLIHQSSMNVFAGDTPRVDGNPAASKGASARLPPHASFQAAPAAGEAGVQGARPHMHGSRKNIGQGQGEHKGPALTRTSSALDKVAMWMCIYVEMYMYMYVYMYMYMYI